MSNEIFAYMRISPTELQGTNKEERLESAQKRIQLQKEIIEAYCKINFPNRPIRWFQDILISGKALDKRTEFIAMLNAAVIEKPFAIACTKISRFARSLKDLLNQADILNKEKIALVFINDNVDTTTANGRFFFQILGAMAELEINLIKERTTPGKRRKKKEMEAEGRNWGRPKLTVIDKITKQKTTLDVDKLKTMKKMGLSYEKMAQEMHCSVKPIWNYFNPKDDENEKPNTN